MATKLYVPRLRPGLVSRPQLLARLDHWQAYRLILLSGPAGNGKTTLLSAWLAQRSCRAAWLSLEPGDSDPARFHRYLIAALRTVLPGVGEASERLLQAHEPPPWETLLPPLVNEIAAAATDPFLLVLDDYHSIDSPAIHSGLLFLIEHLPPQMHLVIGTRIDPPLPLSRFRSRGQMLEIRASDMRFSSDEAGAFLTQTMGLELSPEQVAILEARTEGWIAGLQIVALSMQGRSPQALDELVTSFSGSHRHIMDYMVDEVLSRQPEATQAFLLRTSVLERLNGPLCDAVTGQDGGQATLEHLERANLFLAPLDDERRWCRYHHLFADLLRARLQQLSPGLTSELHGRAAGWYEESGLVREAIRHALAAGDAERAARLVDAEAGELLTWGEYTTLLTWAAALPWEVVRRNAWLCVCCGWSAIWLGRQPEAERWLQAAEQQALEEPGTAEAERVLGGLAAVRACMAHHQGDLAETVRHGQLALQLLPGNASPFRVAAAHMLGDASFDRGDLDTAEQAWSEELRMAQEVGSAGLLVYPLRALSGLYRERGQLRRAEEVYRQALQLAGERSTDHWWLGRLYAALGEILWERDDREAAMRYLRDGVASDRTWRGTFAVPSAYCPLVDALRAEGDLEEAAALMEAAEQMARGRSLAPRSICQAETTRVRLWLAQGNLEAAERWARDSQARRGALPAMLLEMEEVTRVRVALVAGRCDEALTRLAPLAEAADRQQRYGALIEILVLQALAMKASGCTTQALACLEKALSLAETEGYVRVFTNEGPPMAALLAQMCDVSPTYVARLLTALRGAKGGGVAAGSGTQQAGLVEPLSARELEVLRLLAEGLTNQEIAQRLFITLATVKSHTSSIYGKLGVHSRREATAAAARLGLLP